MALPPRLLTGTVISTVGRTVGTLVSIGTIAVITRSLVATLGPDDGLTAYGAYATVLAYLAIVTILADGGFYLVFTRGAARVGVDEQSLLETVWRLRFLSAVVVLLLGSALAFLLPYSGAIRLGIVIGMWGATCQLLSQLLMGVFQKRLRLATPALAEVVGRLVQFVAVVLVALRGGGVLAFLGAFVGGTFITLIINLAGARRFVPFRLWGSVDRAHARAVLREAWPLAASLVLSVIFFKVDALLLSLLRPPGDVALYALPYKVLESLLFFPAMVGGMLLPVFAQASTADRRQVARPLREAADLFLLGALPASALLFVAAPWIVVLLGGEVFLESAPVLRILAVTLGVLFLGNLFGNAVIAIGEQRRLLRVYAFLTIVNIAANLVVIPRYSYLGAAWTTFGTELLSVLLTAAILLKRQIPVVGTPHTSRILLAASVLVALLFLPLDPLLRVIVAYGGYGLVLVWTGVVLPRSLFHLIRAQRIHGASHVHGDHPGVQ